MMCVATTIRLLQLLLAFVNLFSRADNAEVGGSRIEAYVGDDEAAARVMEKEKEFEMDCKSVVPSETSVDKGMKAGVY